MLPRTLLALTQASTPTSARFTFRSTALKSLSLVWISDVNSGLRLEKALLVYIYTQDLYLTLSANGPQSCLSQKSGISIDQCCLLPPCPSSEQQGLPSPSPEAAPLLWDHDSRLQALLQPPMFPLPCSNSFSGCPRRMLMPETRFWGRFIEQGRLLHHYNHLTSGSITRFGKPGSCRPACLFFKILSPLKFLKMS